MGGAELCSKWRKPLDRGRRLAWWTPSAFVASLLVLQAGCLTVRLTEGQPLPQDRIAAIREGETTKTEILEWFGAPTGFSDSRPLEVLLGDYELGPEDVFELPFADALVFRFSRTRLKGRYFVVYLGAQVRVESETLVVFFDEKDRVRYYGYSGALSDDAEAQDGEASDE